MGFLKDNDGDGSVLDDGINLGSQFYGGLLGAGGAATAGLGGIMMAGAGMTAFAPPVAAALGMGGMGLAAAGTLGIGLGTSIGLAGTTGIAGEVGQGAVGLAGMVGSGIAGAAESASDYFFPPPAIAPGTPPSQGAAFAPMRRPAVGPRG